MSARKSERLMNLLIMLLVASRHLSRDDIRHALYADASDEAFDKMFERDKEELRQLGVPIDMASQDAFFDDALGYRINRSEFELPDISLEADEAAVLGLAARVWQHAGLAGETSDALVKLRAAGVPVDRAALDIVEPRLTAEEPSFDAFWQAVQTRSPVTFGYRRSGAAKSATRRVEPWRVAWSSGRWYVLGHDLDRDEPRLFRLSRVQGEVAVGAADSYRIPTDVDLDAMTRQLAPAPPRPAPATVLVRAGAGYALRRAAGSVEDDVAGPDTASAWSRLTLLADHDQLADDVLAAGPDAVVEGPADLVSQVVGRLRAVVGTGADGAS